ncbi:hypothetical protein DBR06_SOUSAS510264, partial [Sousa chinensis]
AGAAWGGSVVDAPVRFSPDVIFLSGPGASLMLGAERRRWWLGDDERPRPAGRESPVRRLRPAPVPGHLPAHLATAAAEVGICAARDVPKQEPKHVVLTVRK